MGEAKTNQILINDKKLTPIGNTNIDPIKITTKEGWAREMTVYNGSTGIDGIFRGKDGKIYINYKRTAIIYQKKSTSKGSDSIDFLYIDQLKQSVGDEV